MCREWPFFPLHPSSSPLFPPVRASGLPANDRACRLGEAKSYSREHHRVRSIPLTKGALPCAVFVFRYRPPGAYRPLRGASPCVYLLSD